MWMNGVLFYVDKKGSCNSAALTTRLPLNCYLGYRGFESAILMYDLHHSERMRIAEYAYLYKGTRGALCQYQWKEEWCSLLRH
ncbi:hypothetical protein CEXT_488051 [Caerostris extrusa]|uniref:Uncharacterized protein n=1 Tax=Caerostris extrusa TaxID=172846 RepID=A0AAV4PS39_CAEEX|nr:hypothetical protein CEXT_488051 [Caerostris extrusa]